MKKNLGGFLNSFWDLNLTCLKKNSPHFSFISLPLTNVKSGTRRKQSCPSKQGLEPVTHHGQSWCQIKQKCRPQNQYHRCYQYILPPPRSYCEISLETVRQDMPHIKIRMYGNIVHAIPKGILRIYNTMILDLRETIDLMRKVFWLRKFKQLTPVFVEYQANKKRRRNRCWSPSKNCQKRKNHYSHFEVFDLFFLSLKFP